MVTYFLLNGQHNQVLKICIYFGIELFQKYHNKKEFINKPFSTSSQNYIN